MSKRKHDDSGKEEKKEDKEPKRANTESNGSGSGVPSGSSVFAVATPAEAEFSFGFDSKDEKKGGTEPPALGWWQSSPDDPIVDFSNEVQRARFFPDLVVVSKDKVKHFFSRGMLVGCTAKVLGVSLGAESKERKTDIDVEGGATAVNALLNWLALPPGEARIKWLEKAVEAIRLLASFSRQSTEKEVTICDDQKSYTSIVTTDSPTQEWLMNLGLLAFRYEDPVLVAECSSHIGFELRPTDKLMEYYRTVKEKIHVRPFVEIMASEEKYDVAREVPDVFALEMLQFGLMTTDVRKKIAIMRMALPNISDLAKIPVDTLNHYAQLVASCGEESKNMAVLFRHPRNANEKRCVQELARFAVATMLQAIPPIAAPPAAAAPAASIFADQPGPFTFSRFSRI